MATTPGDRTLAALEQFIPASTQAAADLQVLVERAQAVRDQLADGRSLSEVIEHEPRPLIIACMTELLDRLTDAAAAVRRAEAHDLRDEGYSHARTAELFGVTRQRAAALLAPPPAGPGRAAKRPRPKDH